MTMYIPNGCNSSIVFQAGDSFETIKHQLMRGDDVVIVNNKIMREYQYKKCNARVVTLHELSKFIQQDVKYRRVILDIRLPRPESKIIEKLADVCEGRIVSFFRHPHDMLAMSSALYLLNKTRSDKLKIVTFSAFMHFRKY